MEELKVHDVIGCRVPAIPLKTRSASLVPLGQWFGVALPEGARVDQLKAELRAGILTVSVPVQETGENQISIQREGAIAMSEVQVRKEQKEQSVAKRQPTDFFAPMFPFERAFGLTRSV